MTAIQAADVAVEVAIVERFERERQARRAAWLHEMAEAMQAAFEEPLRQTGGGR